MQGGRGADKIAQRNSADSHIFQKNISVIVASYLTLLDYNNKPTAHCSLAEQQDYIDNVSTTWVAGDSLPSFRVGICICAAHTASSETPFKF
jgi:hypothetical protein